MESGEVSKRLWGIRWRAEQCRPCCPRLDLLMAVRERTRRRRAAVKGVFDGAKCVDGGDELLEMPKDVLLMTLWMVERRRLLFHH